MALDELRAKIEAARAEGDLLTAIDRVREAAGIATGADLAEMRRLEVLLLARIASSEEAAAKFAEHGLDADPGADARSLKARLEKDRAFELTGPARIAALESALAGYRAVLAGLEPDWDRTAWEYNAINVATLAHILGRETGEPRHAAMAAELCDALSRRAPQPDYWSRATRAELRLLQGDEAGAVEALEAALKAGPATPEMRLTTLTQIGRIAPDSAAAAVLRGGPFVHYSGHMIQPPGAETGRFLARHEAAAKARIRAALEALAPDAVYGAVASGVDILVLEAVAEMNADRPGRPIEARLFLPFRAEDFYRRSIKPAGPGWGPRARACMAAPHVRKISYLTHEASLPGDALAFGLSSRHAMGAAILDAARLGKEAAQLVAWDGRDGDGVAGAAADRRIWAATGRRQVEVPIGDLSGPPAPQAAAPAPAGPPRAARALVFGDVKNFSKLKEAQLPAFVAAILGAVKAALAAADAPPGALRLSNSWGDGVFAVFDRAAAAARFALDLQARMAALDLGALGLPGDLAIRLGMHFGAVYEVDEPVTGRPNVFGEAVARAARIEPITTEGRIFVSEEFAAELALDPDSPAIAEYVGEKDAAKNYGRFRLYRIRPAGGAPG